MVLHKLFYIARIAYHDYNTIWRHRYKVDLGIGTRWSLGEKIKYNRLGYTNEDYHCFDLKHRDYRNYISYRERWRLEDINGRFAFILGEKLIAKPTRSVGGGTGVHLLMQKGDALFVDDREVSPDQLARAVSSWAEYIVVDFVSQAEYAATIYPDATNSIRIITAQRKNGDYEVLLAFHRFGTDQSRPVDNISSGGLCALINVETGVIGAAMTKIEPGKAVPVHPDTQSQIEGGAVPNWGELKRKLLQVHRCFPYYVFFAWDIVIDENGEPTALEINRGSDLGIQMIQPQRHEKLGAFMREYGLLEKW